MGVRVFELLHVPVVLALQGDVGIMLFLCLVECKCGRQLLTFLWNRLPTFSSACHTFRDTCSSGRFEHMRRKANLR